MSLPPRHLLILSGALLLTCLAYWTGLSGPFLFDDLTNFTIIQAWLDGKASAQQAILGHQSLFYARPLAMLTFLLSAAVGGGDGFFFKLGNLLMHLACGLLVYSTLRRSLLQDPPFASKAALAASALTALWLLHPLHVSTVLYVVQRMAQLSTFFTLGCVCVYFLARRQLNDGQEKKAALHLFISFPVLMLLGMLCKQNAAVAPALCAVFEIAYFQGRSPASRWLRRFFALFLILPVLLAAAVLAVRPGILLGDYALYDFSLGERLLSQPRALLDYLGQLLFPRGPLMGLYTDDFEASKSLFSPISTLYSLLLLTGISVWAIAWRKRIPSFFAGWFFFLVAHGMESGFLPLDLYFEHRNYLPSVGILLAAIGLGEFVLRRTRTNVLSVGTLASMVCIGLILVFSFGTFSRAEIWRSKQSIVDQGLRNHPFSMRANLDKAAMAFDAKDIIEHDAVLRRMTHSPQLRQRFIGKVYLVTSNCVLGRGGRRTDLANATEEVASTMTLTEVYAFANLASASGRSGCGDIGPGDVADRIVHALEVSRLQPPTVQAQWLLRYQAARLYADAGRWKDSQREGELAWQPNSDPAVGAHLAQVYARQGMYDAAFQTLRDTTARTKCHDVVSMTTLGQLWMAFGAQQQGSGEKATPPPHLACRRF